MRGLGSAHGVRRGGRGSSLENRPRLSAVWVPRKWGYGRDYAHDEAIRITNQALDLGINLIDTAEIYGFGQSERIVGRAIVGRRDEVFVATKIWPLMPYALLFAQGPAQRPPPED